MTISPKTISFVGQFSATDIKLQLPAFPPGFFDAEALFCWSFFAADRKNPTFPVTGQPQAKTSAGKRQAQTQVKAKQGGRNTII